MGSRSRSLSLGAAALLWTACTSEPQLIASNCEMGEACLKTAALKLDAVDILLVVDDSPSVINKAEQLKTELPHLLEAITTGQADGLSFAPAKSVHVAVTTTDMGGPANQALCTGNGQDGIFIKPGDWRVADVSCNMAYPAYLAYSADGSASSEESASCVPVVFADPASGGTTGCGFEQPLEAALKSVWPEHDSSLLFDSSHGHGDAENAGFLRENSVLVVLVVSDEDDCSVSDRDVLTLSNPNSVYAKEPVNLRCYLNPDKLYAPARYIDHLKALRPNNDNVIFTVIGGIPPELVSDEFRSHYDFEQAAQVEQYFTDVLAADAMQEVPENEHESTGILRASCASMVDGEEYSAMPPRRMVEVARGFGSQAVLGSICASDFGTTTGQLIRRLAEKLDAGSTH